VQAAVVVTATGVESMPAPATAVSIAGMRILVAEDNEHNQLLIELLLKKQGIQSVMVSNGVEAIENLRQNSYDLVLMDLEMPVMGGFEAVAAIREDEKKTGTHMAIVALSAHSPEEQREPCIAAGMDDFMMKPIDVKALHAMLRRFAPAGAVSGQAT